MIESIQFKNFKALRDTTLPLSRFTLIVGPNGSGKTTALKAFSTIRDYQHFKSSQILTVGMPNDSLVSLVAKRSEGESLELFGAYWSISGSKQDVSNRERGRTFFAQDAVLRSRFYCIDADAIASPVLLQPRLELLSNGANLAGVLDRLRDEHPERFKELNEQLGHWIPEFDQVLFETPGQGTRSLALRTSRGGHKISGNQLSQGTLIALALLTIAFLPDPPPIVCLEEPDRGLHPRLLRDVRDALYRLAYPDETREKRKPVQVIATTHNPYFLDLFRDHPEEIVIAEKVGLEATFSRLSDRSDLGEILADAPLSEVWYSGVLGGVPSGT